MNSARERHLSQLGADSVLICHLLVSIYAVAGGFLALVDPGYALVHIPLVLWVSIVNLAHWTCPLTPLEQKLRLRSGGDSFKGSWIQHYCEPVLRPLGMPRRLELVAGVSIVVWNLAVYITVFLIGFR